MNVFRFSLWNLCTRDPKCRRFILLITTGSFWKVIDIIDSFLAMFQNEIMTILTHSISEGDQGIRWTFTFFVLEVPGYKSAMLIYLT